jgi:anti-sigma B factor antagonist
MIKIVTNRKDATTQEISIIGELDTTSAFEAEKMFGEQVTELSKEIVVDLTQLSYISSSGLRFLLGAQKSATASGGHIAIKGMSDMVSKIFNLTGLDKLFKFFP